jgi:Rrf2 family protein
MIYADYSHIMSQVNVQFSVASHVMAALGTHYGEPLRSGELAGSVNADPTFVRRVVSKLAKAGLVTTLRGKGGACALARPPERITLLDIYRASEAPPAFAVHGYPVTEGCRVSRNIKGCMRDVLAQAQADFERSLAGRTLADIVAAIGQGG